MSANNLTRSLGWGGSAGLRSHSVTASAERVPQTSVNRTSAAGGMTVETTAPTRAPPAPRTPRTPEPRYTINAPRDGKP